MRLEGSNQCWLCFTSSTWLGHILHQVAHTQIYGWQNVSNLIDVVNKLHSFQWFLYWWHMSPTGVTDTKDTNNNKVMAMTEEWHEPLAAVDCHLNYWCCHIYLPFRTECAKKSQPLAILQLQGAIARIPAARKAFRVFQSQRAFAIATICPPQQALAACGISAKQSCDCLGGGGNRNHKLDRLTLQDWDDLAARLITEYLAISVHSDSDATMFWHLVVWDVVVWPCPSEISHRHSFQLKRHQQSGCGPDDWSDHSHNLMKTY